MKPSVVPSPPLGPGPFVGSSPCAEPGPRGQRRRWPGAAPLAHLLTLALLVTGCAHTPPPARTLNPTRQYFERLLEVDPVGNPQLVFLLMGQYSATRQQRAGLDFFERRLQAAGAAMPAEVRALYLSVCGALRAQTAEQIPLLKRIAWVERALAELDEAVTATEGKMFIVRWLRAVVLAQLPDRFERADQALAELRWAEANMDQAPAPGLLRETRLLQARLLARHGEAAATAPLVAGSGYAALDRELGLTTGFALTRDSGFVFGPQRIAEIVPRRVFQATGYDFMEYYFIVSQDGTALFSIDLGARADSLQSVLADLRRAHPHLPPLAAVFVTHAHWDHVGGQRHARALAPAPAIYASSRWRAQLEDQEGSGGPYQYWWGQRFDLSAVTEFRPDHTVSEPTTVTIGGTTVALIPTRGGETHDALLIHLPAEGLVFAGDIAMPYLGAPHAEEGSVEGLIESIRQLQALAPAAILHGHEGINRLFPSPDALYAFAGPLAWLRDETVRRVARGDTREDIQRANLAPFALLTADVRLHVPFVVFRDHVIDRIVDHKRGYWQQPYQGADHLTDKELGSILVHYAGLDGAERTRLVGAMVEAGDHELALRTAQWLLAHTPDDARLIALRRQALLGMIEKEQVLNAFKFIWFAGGIGFEAAQPR